MRAACLSDGNRKVWKSPEEVKNHSSVTVEDISPISGAGGDRPPHVEFSMLFS